MAELKVNLDEALDAAKQAANEAGAMIRKALRDRAESGMKVTVKGGVDLVTETDRKCEDHILEFLKGKFPDHSFVGEESTFAEGDAASKDPPLGPCWFVDPLDGTTNFVHAYPFVTVSIALAIDRVPVVGVIYNPVMDEMYWAASGKGAFLNDRRISVSGAKGVGEAMVVNNIGPARDSKFVKKTLGRLEELLGNTIQAVRNSGSAAQNMAHVACGSLDAYFEDGYGGPWDVAAGHIIIREAGGVIMEPEGGQFSLRLGKGRMMCGPEPVCKDIARIIRAADSRLEAAASADCRRIATAGVVGAILGAALTAAFVFAKCRHHR